MGFKLHKLVYSVKINASTILGVVMNAKATMYIQLLANEHVQNRRDRLSLDHSKALTDMSSKELKISLLQGN